MEVGFTSTYRPARKPIPEEQQELQSGGEKAGRHFPVIGEGAMTINEMLDELG
jgi:hypothetical protein